MPKGVGYSGGVLTDSDKNRMRKELEKRRKKKSNSPKRVRSMINKEKGVLSESEVDRIRKRLK